MAQVPGVPQPSVAPSSAPLPTQQITPPSEAFGAQVAGSIGHQFAQAANEASDSLAQHALAFQAINNKQAADEASIKNAAAIDTMTNTYRDNNRGMAASDNLHTLYSDIEEARSAGSANLTPAAQLEYNSATRRYASAAMSSMSVFASSERKTAVVGTSTAKQQQAVAAATMSDDPAVVAQSLQTIASEAAFQSRPDVLGLTPDMAKQQITELSGAIWTGKIKVAIDGGDYPAAQTIFNAHYKEMTGPQAVAVQGAMKVGQNAFIANSERIAMTNGIPASPSASLPTPTGPWQTGATAIRADPQGVIGQLVGTGVRVTSGARTPAQNAAAHGSPTSEHLSGNAWDFVPTSGTLNQAAASLAQNLHLKGIPFDQIEVDSRTGHVHVGFGPKNRNELIDQNGQQLASSTGASHGPHYTGPSLTPTTDPQTFIAQSDAAIQQYVDAKYGNNPTLAVAVQSAMHAGMMIQAQQATATQEATFTRLQGAAVEGNVQDLSVLAHAYPGAAQDMANLAPRYHNAIMAGTKANANQWTPDRQTNQVILAGKAATDPQAFVDVDLAQVDLPAGVRQSLMVDQQKVKGQLAKAHGKDPQENTIVNQALASVQGQAALTSLGITKKEAPDDYFQFAGQLQAEVEASIAQTGHPPTQKEMNGIISQVTAGVTHKGLFGGGSFNSVPDASRQTIIAYYKSHNLGEPTEQDIGRMYRMASRGRK